MKRTLVWLVAAVVAVAGPSWSQDGVDDQVRQSSIQLHVTARGGEGREDGMTGAELEADATGVFVSDDGLILTVFHFLGALGPVVPDSIRITGRIADLGANPFEVSVVDGNPNLDLLLLKMDKGFNRPIVKANLGRAYELEGDEVRLAGFSKGQSWQRRTGEITSRDSRAGTLWAVDIEIDSGMSGGPAYSRDGKVIGLAKGDEVDSNIRYIIPIEFADSIISLVRLREINDRLSQVIAPTEEINWTTDEVSPKPTGVAVGDGICFITKVWGLFNQSEDRVGIEVVDGQYVLNGVNSNGGHHGATAQCIKFGN